MATQKKAPDFARRLRKSLAATGKTQRQVAKDINVSSSVLNRLCKDGVGTDGHVCMVLRELGWKRRRILETVADRRAELADGIEKEVWKDFRYAYTDIEEYFSDICPVPIERAYACTHVGVPLGEAFALAQRCGLSHIGDMSKIDPWKLAELLAAFEQQFGRDQRQIVLAKECTGHPHVLRYDFPQSVDAASYLNLVECTGVLLFGLPHLVLGSFEFSEDGRIEVSNMTEAAELVYSLQGEFELTYENEVCPMALIPRKSMWAFDASKKHVLKLSQGEGGCLVIALYYPGKRDVSPNDAFRGIE